MKRKLRNRIITAVVMGLMISTAAMIMAEDNPSISVTADKLSYNGKTYVATATGNVVITRGTATMTLGGALGNSGSLPPALGAFLPDIICGIAGVVLVYRKMQ